jgi:hypothetical protein
MKRYVKSRNIVKAYFTKIIFSYNGELAMRHLIMSPKQLFLHHPPLGGYTTKHNYMTILLLGSGGREHALLGK